MLKAPIPQNEKRRLEELIRLRVLDSAQEGSFDDLTELASQICNSPISLISLVDKDRQWFKSKIGIDLTESARDVSICGHVINQNELFEVPDTHEDERFKDNPFCVGENGIRYYAGFPLITSNGHNIGSFCVIDMVPSKLTEWQKKVLEKLAKQTVLLIEANLRVQLLKDNEEKVHAIFEGSNDAITIANVDGFLDCNRKSLELFKIATKEDFIKFHPGDLSPEFQPDGEASAAKARRLLTLAAVSGYQRFEWTHRKSDGEEFPTEIILTGFEVQGEKVVQATVRDMTEKVKMQRALEHEKKMMVQQSKLAALGQLAAGVGHEINNPVAIINGNMGIIEHELKASNFSHPNIFQIIKKVNIASDRIADIVKGLRTFARSEKEQLRVFSMKNLLLESLDLVTELFQREGIKLEVVIDEDAHFEVSGNRGRMSQVISNLLAKARDASEDLNHRLIRVELASTSTAVHLSVSDSGRGIPAGIKDKIFDPFFTTKDVNKGTGIGLSIVNSIVKEHDGKIHFESELGKGTTFILEIPTHSCK